ncbi:Hsp20/alpha crystallin family protein [Nonomuraea terrae]|uniref:Hsp20/alpha crystallin family protein n=1 Tax=Nonomuraea terrae TaxID=2530383 RepID=A0A4R4YJL4_9ACTN|nr:Hsp20/alpha crystallin family protein [Nonomuraea terrae]TDD45083.1 Hsp20/alpha crystallin family protein [Nonomuraea terrae]
MLLTSIDSFLQEVTRRLDRPGPPVMPMDGVRRHDDVLLHFDVPGVDPGSIEVTVDRGVLSVSATRQEPTDDDERMFVQERPMGSFIRRVYLSEQLDPERIEAACHDGVLTVRIPTLETTRPRKVEIHTRDRTKAVTG